MIPFSPPRMDDKIVEAVTETLRSGWITTGPKTKLFEKEITDYCGNKKTICLSAWTTAAELLLRWFGVGKGDEVIIPAYTYAATANVVIHTGAKPVMVDINPNDFNIDTEAVRKAITSKTKVIMPVDIGGFPCDYSALMEMVQSEEVKAKFQANSEEQKMLGRILVFADAAHSFGARLSGKVSGSFADVSGFSFHAVKNLTTAEGGALAFNLPEPFDHEEIYKNLNIKSLHGQTKDALSKSQVGNWKYDIVEAGYKCNMTDIQAAIGLTELRRYDSESLPRRKAIFDLYDRGFENDDRYILPVHTTEEKISSYHLYSLRIDGITESQRDEIIQNIFETGVSVNVHFVPLPLFSFYKSLGYKMNDYPNSYSQFSRVISLPVYFDLTDAQVAEVIDAVKSSTQKVMS